MGQSRDAPVDEGDERIRARMEACRLGILQLHALRDKHAQLMKEVRDRLPQIPCSNVTKRAKRCIVNDRYSLQSVDSGLAQSLRSCSPPSSLRSSVSGDSAIGHEENVMPYSVYRKLSTEERVNSTTNTGPPIVVTTIASTTCPAAVEALRQRPRSMYERSMYERTEDVVDSLSFSKITPPSQRKTSQEIREMQQARETHLFRASRVVLRSPVNSRVAAVLSGSRRRLSCVDEPLYATPARARNFDSSRPTPFASPCLSQLRYSSLQRATPTWKQSHFL